MYIVVRASTCDVYHAKLRTLCNPRGRWTTRRQTATCPCVPTCTPHTLAHIHTHAHHTHLRTYTHMHTTHTHAHTHTESCVFSLTCCTGNYLSIELEGSDDKSLKVTVSLSCLNVSTTTADATTTTDVMTTTEVMHVVTPLLLSLQPHPLTLFTAFVYAVCSFASVCVQHVLQS